MIGELGRDSLLESLSLNVVSHMLLTQALLSKFAETGGAIVNVSSRLARVGMTGVAGYAASKGALTRSPSQQPWSSPRAASG